MAQQTRSSTGGLSASERAELQKRDADRAKRDHDSKKKLPKVSEVQWTHRDRKKRSVVQEMTRMMRQLNEFLKVDGIRETAFEPDDAMQKQYRKSRMNVMSARDAHLPPEGIRVNADGSVAFDANGDADVVSQKVLDHFMEANDAAVNCILDAIKDPTLNNELEALHSKHADAPVPVRTAMLLVKHLRSLFDSDDFVYRFLHLLEFIEWEQGRSIHVPC